MKKIITGFVFISVLLTACSKGSGNASPENGIIEPASLAAMQQTLSKYKLTLVELGSVRCRPCQMMTPVLQSVASKYKDKVQVVFFDVWKNQAPAQHFRIRVIPVQIVLDATGKELFRHEGFFPENELCAVLDRYLQQ